MKEISRRDIQQVVRRIAERGSPVMANRTLSIISRIFAYGVDNEWLDANPCHRIKKPGGKEAARERFLDSDEILAVWNAIEQQPPREAAILELQLLTGQRIGEIRKMRVEDVDLESAWWTIPAEHSKNERPHWVPLSPPATTIVREQLSKASTVVFPSPEDKSQPISYANIYFIVRRVIESSGVKNWGTHDLRRTVAGQLTGNKLATRLGRARE